MRHASPQLWDVPAVYCLTGMSLKNMAAVLKCMGNDDVVTLKADDDGDKLCLMFESPGTRRALAVRCLVAWVHLFSMALAGGGHDHWPLKR
jgi:hypothetical protein